MSVTGSNNPPPPPSPLVGVVAGGVGIAELGVGPETTATAQAVPPAETGALELMLVGPISTSAVSTLFWLSVTVSRNVIDPEVGAMTVADWVFAPTMAGGFTSGAMTVQA
jgi:hypothetical protein